MKKILFITLLFLAFGVSSASAAVLTLSEWAFNINGTIYPGDPLPAQLDDSSFDYDTGLGSLKWTSNAIGAGYFIAFFDHEIDEAINTFFNEIGSKNGSPAGGQSWEIDEPGFANGDIYDNVSANSLDDGIGTSIYGDTTFPDDVSMAMGWDFILQAGETAYIELMLGYDIPSGFYLSQTDPGSQETIYFSSTLDIRGEQPIPEPATMLLLGTGLAGLFGFGRKRFKK